MIPEYPDFKLLELEDRAEVVDHLMKHDTSLCELCFSTQYLWKDFDRPKLTMINGNLCILIDPLNEEPFFLEPIGQNDAVGTLELMLKHAGSVSRVSKDLVPQLSDSMNALPLRDHFDYLYRVSDFANFKGRKYDGKRNHINRFMREHARWEFAPLQQKDAKDVMSLFERWCALKKGEFPTAELAYEAQRQSLKNAMDNYDSLGLLGGGVWEDGELLGFIVGGALSAETISVHFNYCYLHKSGIATVLLREACRTVFSGFKYANLEQDLGMLGLRKNKESYYPIRLVEKYEIR
jgi:uncharacterized protein